MTEILTIDPNPIKVYINTGGNPEQFAVKHWHKNITCTQEISKYVVIQTYVCVYTVYWIYVWKSYIYITIKVRTLNTHNTASMSYNIL